MLPGSLPQSPQLLPGSKSGSLERLCAQFLTSRSIPPKLFAAEVRAVFRLQVELGWRNCADEVIRNPRDSEMSKRLCKALNLGANYSKRLQEKPLGYTYLWCWALLTNTSAGELFPATPRSVAVHASAVTCSFIRAVVEFADRHREMDWEWKQCLADEEVRQSQQPGEHRLRPGDYCLLFRTLMNQEWARANDRSRETLNAIAKRIIDRHHAEDFQLQHALLSDIETLEGLTELLDRWTVVFYLLIGSQPLNLEFDRD